LLKTSYGFRAAVVLASVAVLASLLPTQQVSVQTIAPMPPYTEGLRLALPPGASLAPPITGKGINGTLAALLSLWTCGLAPVQFASVPVPYAWRTAWVPISTTCPAAYDAVMSAVWLEVIPVIHRHGCQWARRCKSFPLGLLCKLFLQILGGGAKVSGKVAKARHGVTSKFPVSAR
jgi:hypothetical protein